MAYRELNLPQLVWGGGAWLAVTCIAVGPGDARLAGAARREIFERGVRRGARAVRRVPRRGSRARAVPVSAYPLMLEGDGARGARRRRRRGRDAQGARAARCGRARARRRARRSAQALETLAQRRMMRLRITRAAYSPRSHRSTTLRSSSPRRTTARSMPPIAADARARGVLVNVVSAPELGNCATPGRASRRRRRRRGSGGRRAERRGAHSRRDRARSIDARYAARGRELGDAAARAARRRASATGGTRRAACARRRGFL